MTRIRTSAPIDPTDRFTQQIASLKEQVAEIQRSRAWGVGRGVEGRVTTATASSYTNSTTTYTDITATTGDAPSITAALRTDRRYRAVLLFEGTISVATDRPLLRMMEGATAHRQARLSWRQASTQYTGRYEDVFVPLSASSTTYKMQARPETAATVLAVNASSGEPVVFTIEDIGPA